MQIQTKGIILKQTKTMGDKQVLTMFSERYGKISVFINNPINGGRLKSTLCYRPFTLGNYDLYKGRNSFSMGRGETIKSYFKIGENIDKYIEASLVLEFTNKLLKEDEPAPALFSLLSGYFEILERRTREYKFLTLAYKLKAIQICGYMPQLSECVECGKKDEDFMFYVAGGGAICRKCAQDNGLIYKSDSDIIGKISYILKLSIRDMEKLYLDEPAFDELKQLVDEYVKYHLDISDLKSEQIFF